MAEIEVAISGKDVSGYASIFAAKAAAGRKKSDSEPPPSPVLFISSVEISASEVLSAREHFFDRPGFNSPYLVDEDFRQWFFEKVEFAQFACAYAFFKMITDGVDEAIIASLGGESLAETTLAGISFLTGQQRTGEGGVLLTNGHANVFYVRDQFGVLRAIAASWSGLHWDLNANALDSSHPWRSARRVFTLKP